LDYDAGENTIVIVAGANNKLSHADVQQASEIIKMASVVVVQFETPIETAIEALKITKEGKGL
jgi:ribokinase